MTRPEGPAGQAPPPAPSGRLAPVVFALLVLATFGAFFLASRLKAQPPVLRVTEATKLFSPNGDGVRDVQRLTLQGDVSDDDAEVSIVDGDGVTVATVARGVRVRPGQPVTVEWDGRESGGAVAPDGPYRVRVTLGGDGRSLLAPRRFFVDTKPPAPEVSVRRRDVVVSPGQPVRFAVDRLGESRPPRYQVVRTDTPQQRVVARFEGERGDISGRWDGRTSAGRPAPPGTYLIAIAIRDKAGNRARVPQFPASVGEVPGKPGFTVRSLAVQPPVRPVRAGQVTSFRVDARGRAYSWSVRKVGSSTVLDRARRPRRSTTLVIRMPQKGTGLYLVTLRSRGTQTQVPVAVQGRGGAPLTVVLPMITWLGVDPVQDADADDGLPDTLLTGRPVPYPRVFAFPGGLPPGLTDEVAPLLVWLERNDVPYRLTTDLALSLSDDPKPAAGGGLLFAGAPRWVSSGLARRLRAYVQEGGRVALFGTPSLRAGVTVADRALTRPSGVAAQDALTGELGDPRALADGPPLSVTRDEEGTRALIGFSGTLPGFTRVTELTDPGEGRVLAAIGQPLSEAEAAQAEDEGTPPRPEAPAFSVVAQGDGLVARVGVDGWVARLEDGDPAVTQLTYNLVDLLRGERPRPRTAAG